MMKGRNKGGRVTTQEIEDLFKDKDLSDEQIYTVGYYADESWRVFWAIVEAMGFSVVEARRVHRYFNYRSR